MKEYICLFVGSKLMTKTNADGSTTLPEAHILTLKARKSLTLLSITQNDKWHMCAADCPAQTAQELMTDEFQLTDLRPHFLTMEADMFRGACRGHQMVHWERHSRYCPACGTPTEPFLPNARRCPECGYEIFPQIAPACIVLVRRGNEVLMVQVKNFRSNHYGLVAGFLEVGETLEECAERELMEETGIKVKNLKYWGSQPWPFPSGLMIAFTADYLEGDIRIQEEELNDAQFFGLDNMPALPGEMSIARMMIDAWREEQKKEGKAE